jgi:hypothetical protein
MQSRILQVTHLGNFQPGLPWHILDDDHNEGRRRGVLSVVLGYPMIASFARFIPARCDDRALAADRLGNTLSYSALEIMPPATQCGQMISYVFACQASSVGNCYSTDLAFFP